VVRDDTGRAFISDDADLTVLEVQTPPAAQTVNVGENAEFSVIVTPGSGVPGTPPNEYVYQWVFQAASIPSANYSTYTVTSCQGGSPSGNPLPVNPAGDEGNYSCYVGDSASAILQTLPVPLTVSYDAISFMEQPQSITRYAGRDYMLSCTVAGGVGAPYTYQWCKDGTAPANYISGANESQLLLENLDIAKAQAGDYTCLVGEEGVRPPAPYIQSATATVAVVPPMVFESMPEDSKVYIGEEHSIEVIVSGPAGTPAFEWQLNDVPISGATDRTYTMPSVDAEDAGTYVCVVTDDMGTPGDESDDESMASSPVVIEVAPHLEILVQPQGGTKNVRESHEFTVLVSGGFEPLTYQWTRNDEVIPGADGPTYAIDSLRVTDDGYYMVEVSDDYIDVRQSDTVRLEVEGSLPIGVAGLSILAGLCLLGGGIVVRRTR
ncbi:MAG TPA: hypothetical protein ENN80_06305, partial [Candidatus Hydrogenedentes bacterium]|nr:hypothetical protein [Candidatus Hydrogenedentota bacterium]